MSSSLAFPALPAGSLPALSDGALSGGALSGGARSGGALSGGAPWSSSSSALAVSEATLTATADNERRVIASRARRIVFGSSLVAGAGALVLRSLVADVSGGAVPSPAAWEIVVITWLVALATTALAGPIAGVLVAGRPRVTVDDDTLVASLTLPAAGLALVLPVTLHMPLAIFLGGVGAFDVWCTASVALVGHAHVVLAVLCAHRAAGVIDGDRRRDDGSVQGAPAASRRRPGAAVQTPAAIYVVTILMSAVPFGAVHVVPPLLVALTGLPLLALLPVVERILERERALLAPAP